MTKSIVVSHYYIFLAYSCIGYITSDYFRLLAFAHLKDKTVYILLLSTHLPLTSALVMFAKDYQMKRQLVFGLVLFNEFVDCQNLKKR